MKQIMIFGGVAISAVILAAYAKSKKTGATQGTGPAAQSYMLQVGALDPNYSSAALVFNADQKARAAGPNANPNPIVGWFANIFSPPPEVKPSGTTALTCGSPSGNSSGCSKILPGGGPSPTFWAADKVPTNPALGNSDADESLAVGWFNV